MCAWGEQFIFTSSGFHNFIEYNTIIRKFETYYSEYVFSAIYIDFDELNFWHVLMFLLLLLPNFLEKLVLILLLYHSLKCVGEV